MKKASYDVTFVPMTNVEVEVADPYNPTEGEQERIIEAACRKRFPAVSSEDVAEIRLYEVEGKEVFDRKVIFDSGSLKRDDDPIGTTLESIKKLAKSGYIPFSSPCPSSTEKALRDSVLSAISLLEKAQILEKELNRD